MKKNRFLILLIPALICSCKAKLPENPANNENNNTLNNAGPSFVYKEAKEEPIDISTDGMEVTDIDVINIPNAGIKVGMWDDANIKLHVSYSDNSSEDFDFKVKHFPLEQRHHLGEIGHHNLQILINGFTTKFGFNIVKNPEFKGYKCKFIDSYTGEQKYETTVGYYENVAYGGDVLPDHPTDVDFISTFIGWDYPTEYVHQDMIYTSVYRDVEKRYYGYSVKAGESHVVSTYYDKDNAAWNVLSYIGRVHRVAVNYSETIYHQKGDEDKELSFLSMDLFNERWDETNKNIVKYGLDYSFDNTVGQHLFGSNNSFGSSPTCLSAFESMYKKNTYDTTLDTGEAITTSPYPGYKSVYNKANSVANVKKTVTSDLETGYYRLAATMTFDVYLSFSLTKLNNGKFELATNSKFHMSPRVESIAESLQWSSTSEFINNFDKKAEYSNKMFYDIALGLDWGN